jgi:hypothetical protein
VVFAGYRSHSISYERAPEIKPLGVGHHAAPACHARILCARPEPGNLVDFFFPLDVRGCARRNGCKSGTHQPRAAAGFHRHQGRAADIGDKLFDNLDKHITQYELCALSENYKRIAGFALADVAGR